MLDCLSCPTEHILEGRCFGYWQSGVAFGSWGLFDRFSVRLAWLVRYGWFDWLIGLIWMSWYKKCVLPYYWERALDTVVWLPAHLLSNQLRDPSRCILMIIDGYTLLIMAPLRSSMIWCIVFAFLKNRLICFSLHLWSTTVVVLAGRCSVVSKAVIIKVDLLDTLLQDVDHVTERT